MNRLAVLSILTGALAAPLCMAQRGPAFTPPWAPPTPDESAAYGPGAGWGPINAVLQFLVMAPPPAIPPPPPPPPPRPVVHEYRWSESAHDEATATSYLIVLADSTVRRAIAVWHQDGALHFLMPDSTSGVVRLDAVDREATRRVNAERGLTLSLPDPVARQ